MKKLRGIALRGRIAVAFFALALLAGVLGVLLPKWSAAFAEESGQPLPVADEALQAPVLEGEATRTYNGETQIFTVSGYDANKMSFASSIMHTVEGNKVYFRVTDVNPYEVEFTPKTGYVWAEGQSGKVGFTVTKATDQSVSFPGAENGYSFAYGEEIVINPVPKYPAEKENVTLSYYTYNAESGSKGDSLGSNVLPTNAGVYYAAVNVAGTSNYEAAESGVVVVIEKKEIKVSVTVNVAYGQKITAGDIRYTMTGFAEGETAQDSVSVNLEQFTQGISYGEGTGVAEVGSYDPVFATTETTVNAYTDKTAKSLNGFYKKGIADNYYFTATDSSLVTVSKLSVSAVIGNASGSFGSTPQYNNDITLRWADNAQSNKIPQEDRVKQDKELMSLLNVSGFTGTATMNSDVGEFPITQIAVENDKYDVTFMPGVYTVQPAKLVVEWTAGGGSYENVTAPEVGKISALIGNASQPLSGGFETQVKEALGYRFTNGTGSQIFNIEEVPQNAGNYYVKLVLASEGAVKNYVLSETSAAPKQFTVNKLVLDVNKLSIDDSDGKLEYKNGEVVTPVLNHSDISKYFTVGTVDEARTHGIYYVPLTITNFSNVEWSVGKTAVYKLPFTVAKAKNAIAEAEFIADGWTYGETEKLPPVTLTIAKDASDGTTIALYFEYSSNGGADWTRDVPRAAGSYCVRARANGTANVEEYVSPTYKQFVIEHKKVAKPQLEITTANNVYTGEDLHASVSGFDQEIMKFEYVGSFSMNESDIALTVHNAGTYTLKITLFDANCVWEDDDGNAVYEQTWTVAPKPIEKPSAGTVSFPATDKVITYLPDGFDANTMTITGNEARYSDTFTAEISLKDGANYVWKDGSTESIKIEWKIGGVNKTFAALISLFVIIAVLAAGAGVAQFLFFKRRQESDAGILDTEGEEDGQTDQTNEGGEQA